MEALQRVAAANLQRVYRGYLGDDHEDEGDRHLPTTLSSSSYSMSI